MLDAAKWGLSGKLLDAMPATADHLQVAVRDAARYVPAAGTGYYLTLRTGGHVEVVYVTSVVGSKVYVRRGEDDTEVRAWPAGTCVAFEWNPAQLKDFLADQVQGDTPTITPGTYCLNCNTCLTLDASGRITEVNGGSSC